LMAHGGAAAEGHSGQQHQHLHEETKTMTQRASWENPGPMWMTITM